MRLTTLALLMGLSALAHAEEVVWAIVDTAPYHMDGEKGPAKSVDELGQGITDHLIRGLAARMPGYQHRFVHTSRIRMWRDMATGARVCYADAFKTAERLRWAHFTAVTPPIRQLLVTRKGTLAGGGELSLATLLRRTDLRGAFETDRSYGQTIDGLLAQPAANVRRLALPDGPPLLRMLESGRMDYLVEYAPALTYLLDRLDPKPELDFHHLVEERHTTAAHVACTRNAWGLRVVKAIDSAMRDWARQPEAGAALLRWTPQDIAAQDIVGMERFYRERAQRVDVE